jgi:hypothetical protein
MLSKPTYPVHASEYIRVKALSEKRVLEVVSRRNLREKT